MPMEFSHILFVQAQLLQKIKRHFNIVLKPDSSKTRNLLIRFLTQPLENQDDMFVAKFLCTPRLIPRAAPDQPPDQDPKQTPDQPPDQFLD